MSVTLLKSTFSVYLQITFMSGAYWNTSGSKLVVMLQNMLVIMPETPI